MSDAPSAQEHSAHPHDAGSSLDEHGHEDGNVHVHIASLGFYVAIFLALIFFTLLTVAVSNIHLGKLNLVVAIVIASMKASLVVLFFMHLNHDRRFNAIILVVSMLFIGVFFAYTTNDTERRGEVDLDQGVKVLASTGLPAPGGIPAASAAPVVKEGAPESAPKTEKAH